MKNRDVQLQGANLDGIYQKFDYDSLERFASYYYQIQFIVETNPNAILEIGIGNKTVTNYLKAHGFDVTNCDFDENLKPDIVADIRNLPFDDNSYDTVAAFEVLEHIAFDGVESALSELARVSNGNVIISIPYSCACIENILRIDIPFFQRLFHFVVRIPYFPIRVIFEKNKVHYWEMGRRGYSRYKIRKVIKKYFKINKEFQGVLNSYQYFFLVEPVKRGGL